MLKVENVSYAYEDYQVIKDISLSLERGQTIAIIGKSGVGKSTLFNLIAGHLQASTGSITIDGQTTTKGQVSYMLQKDMLLAHLTVLENLMLPLLIQNIAKTEAKARSMQLLEDFELDKWANHYPHALSGGMRQRIAFLRTANFQREWVLLDEAFSALDAVTRRALHRWYQDYAKKMQWSKLLITHDVDESLILADKVYVLSGRPGQVTFELEVDFEKDDFENLIFDPAFLEAKKQLLVALEQ